MTQQIQKNDLGYFAAHDADDVSASTLKKMIDGPLKAMQSKLSDELTGKNDPSEKPMSEEEFRSKNPNPQFTMKNNTPIQTAVPNIFPIVVNGYKINVLEGDSTFKFSVETKTVGLNGAGPTIVKFTRLSDARRWTRLN